MTILRNEILNMMIAVRDSVRNDHAPHLLAHRLHTNGDHAHFAMYCLAMHPDVMNRPRDPVRDRTQPLPDL